ncbi:MAG: Na+/H+ antiporter NhaA [Desulfuromonadales bacterium]|nr:Na+/H+ antiporter NhaA [Desulfuromonadales bacterium]NIS42942.1 Na+/H+ antiporter NhaA [Desulfuromonadales bacterium]
MVGKPAGICAFTDPLRVDSAKTGIFLASILTGVGGYLLLARLYHGSRRS